MKSKDLLLDFQRFVDYYNPGYVLVENVPGIITNKESVLPVFLNFLAKKGYVTKYKIVDMSYYGVPQSRKRFSLIASGIDRNIDLPEPDKKQVLLEDFIGVTNGFPPIKAGHTDKTPFKNTVSALNEICLKRLDITPHNGGSRLAWR
jgi:DNA (cytosine-5)-methyltransferase 1